MPNQTIISMQKTYPFGSFPIPNKQSNQVMVRKQINTGNKHELISKSKLLKKLQVPNSIHIISIFQGFQSIEIYYEYVPVKFEIWMKNMSDYLSDNLSKELYILTTFLAENRISTLFNPENLGLDKNYHIKYFIDLENTIYNEFQNPLTLKQKYYRDINLFLKSFNSLKEKSHKNPLFSSLNNLKTQSSDHYNQSIRSFPRNLERTMSFGSLEEDKITFASRTETTDHQVPQNKIISKQSVLKKEITRTNLNQKLKNIKQKLEIVKQKGPKIFFSSMELQKKTSINDISIKRIPTLKKVMIQKKLSSEVSINDLIEKIQNDQKSLISKQKKGSESEKDPLEDKSFFLSASNQMKKSKKFMSQKSESPIEYMDFMKSRLEYMQDFLNVLEDSSEQEGNVYFEVQKYQFSEYFIPQTSLISVVETQESQNLSQSEDQKWQVRFDAAIKKSQKLINRMRSPSKLGESILRV